MSVSFVGPQGVNTYRAIALKHGLKLYAKTGMRPNRAWTLTAMLRNAGELTGKTYNRGQSEQAIADLDTWIDANGTTGH